MQVGPFVEEDTLARERPALQFPSRRPERPAVAGARWRRNTQQKSSKVPLDHSTPACFSDYEAPVLGAYLGLGMVGVGLGGSRGLARGALLLALHCSVGGAALCPSFEKFSK